jgi:acyl dehydratase
MDTIPPLPFDTVEFGDEIGPVSWVPTTDIVRRYAAAARVTDRRFIDPERARQVGFAKPIVPGPLSASFLAKVLRNHFVGWRIKMLSTSFRTPVAHGDRLSCWGMVTEKKLEDGVGLVDCDVVIENQNGDRVIVGTAILSCPVQT